MSSVSGVCSMFFFSSRRRHTRLQGDWSSDVCSSDLGELAMALGVDVELADHLVVQAQGHAQEGLEAVLSCPLSVVDRKSTRLNSSHLVISYAVFCLKKKKNIIQRRTRPFSYTTARTD